MSNKPKFTYGDQIRRVGGGPVRTVRNVGSEAYYFEDGTFALIDDEDCYQMVQPASGFFLVATTLDTAPMARYTDHGYERREDFREALLRLIDWFGGRVGERIDSRHGHLLLRFHDTPGGRPDQTWLPLYLLTPAPRPPYLDTPPPDPLEEELNAAFGFDWWKEE